MRRVTFVMHKYWRKHLEENLCQKKYWVRVACLWNPGWNFFVAEQIGVWTSLSTFPELKFSIHGFSPALNVLCQLYEHYELWCRWICITRHCWRWRWVGRHCCRYFWCADLFDNFCRCPLPTSTTYCCFLLCKGMGITKWYQNTNFERQPAIILWKGLSLIDSWTHLIQPSRSSSVAVESLAVQSVTWNSFWRWTIWYNAPKIYMFALAHSVIIVVFIFVRILFVFGLFYLYLFLSTQTHR